MEPFRSRVKKGGVHEASAGRCGLAVDIFRPLLGSCPAGSILEPRPFGLESRPGPDAGCSLASFPRSQVALGHVNIPEAELRFTATHPPAAASMTPGSHSCAEMEKGVGYLVPKLHLGTSMSPKLSFAHRHASTRSTGKLVCSFATLARLPAGGDTQGWRSFSA